MNKVDQVEVIKFLKSPEYQKILKKYNNKYQDKLDKFTAKYFNSDEGYTSNEAEYSENAMQSSKYMLFIERINDITGESRGAELVKKILEEQADNIKTHPLNSVTNSFGMSKDVAVFTEDDMHKFKMLHEKDFHIFIVGMMNTRSQQEIEMSLQEKYDIYENPEDQLSDDEEIVVG